MPKLILSMDGLVLKEIALDRERLTIGRKPNNDVQIDNLAISGQHAVITTILDDAFLEDQNSTNGTYVNGQPIKKHVLRNNDVVELGKYRLKYIVDAAKPGMAKSDYIDTAALKPVLHSPEADAVLTAGTDAERSAATQTSAPKAPAAAGDVDNRMGVIRVFTGANAGRELELSKPLTTLGKPGKQVAVITRRMHGYFITHVEGASFPLVNGKAMDAQARQLKDRDVIEIAGVRMGFSLRS
jgi:predicted component of type VI protein secretion system